MDDATAAVLEAAVDTTGEANDAGGGGGGESKEVEIERAGVVMVMLSGTKKILFVFHFYFVGCFYVREVCRFLASDCRRGRQRRKK